MTLAFVEKATQTTQSTTQSTTQTTQSTTQATQATTQATQGGYPRRVDRSQAVYRLTDLQLNILNEMRRMPDISQVKLSEKLNVNVNTLKYHVKKLRDDGLLGREGSSQKGFWIVKL